MLPDPIKKFADLFSALPSLGPRQATRLAFYLASRGKAEIAELANALARLANLETCAECFAHYTPAGKTSGNLCRICGSPARNQQVIAIVEKETDLSSIEATKKFPGRYLVLGEVSRDGVLETEQKLRLAHLKHSIGKRLGQAEEIILALSPTTLGDIEAGLLVAELKPIAKKITRLGRGLPTGGEIEFADEDTLGGALDNRR